jgi:hypothetical protein
MALMWEFLVDWSNLAGSLTDELGRVMAVSSARGRERAITANGPEHMAAGRATVTLDNWDGRYDPFNGESDLYLIAAPGSRAELRVSEGGVTRAVISGFVTSIRPQGVFDTAVVTIEDGWEILGRQFCTNTVLQTNYTVKSALQALVAMSDLPFATSGGTFPGTFPLTLGAAEFEDNGDTMAYWWATPDISILEAMLAVTDAFWGKLFISAGGDLTYRTRNSTANVKASLSQKQLLRDMEVAAGWDEVFSEIAATAWPLVEQSSGELWKLGDKPLIKAGATLTVWAQFQYTGIPCPATSVTTPASTTDYTANTLANGSGTNKTSAISIVMTTYAAQAKLEITNGDAGDVYLTLMRLRGVALIALSGTTVAQSHTAAFARQFSMPDNDWIQTTVHAGNLVTFLGMFLPDIKRNPRVRFEERFDVQFGYELGNVVPVTIEMAGPYSSPVSMVDMQFEVGKITHEWQAGSGCVTTLYLEAGTGQFTGLGTFPGTFPVAVTW